MNEDAREAELPASELPESDASAIARHRDALKRMFPLPSPDELAPRKSRKKIAVPILVVALLAAFVVWNPVWRHESHATANGERESIELSDGSRIVLDADSRIDVSMRLRSRHVELLAGRALFEVAPARWRPFEVDAGDAKVRVVGTVFDVRRGGDVVVVTVVKGLVAVTPGAGDGALLLRPGQRVDARRNGVGKPVAVDAETATSWTRGRLVFDHTPLGEVVAELQRYRRAPVRLADPALGRLQVSGVFDSTRVDEALNLLPQILPVEVVSQSDGSARIVAR